MKRIRYIIYAIAIGFALIATNNSFAQSASTIQLEQTPGKFTTKRLNLKAGKYVFEVKNNGIDHEVGFVISPEGKTDQQYHIQSAYLSKTIKNGESAKSGEVILTKGEYVFFCPLNPTPQYKIVVK